ncbi:MAG: hypothetical protein ABSG89_11845 [Bacteroidales bacterium]|jgi:hypothetical protein
MLFNHKTRVFIISAMSILTIIDSNGQKADFNGQVAAWGSINFSDGTGAQMGGRYIPELSAEIPAGKKFKLDGDLSADGLLTYTHVPDSVNSVGSKAEFYRFWLRFSGQRFELRAGLQKISFGSAQMLRPLMWFDRIDPRDPLHLTEGVYGIQGKYTFRNNANIWLWMLYGNKNPTGWETIPSEYKRPELGGRIQIPVPRGEMAFTYHNRVAEFPDNFQPPVTGKNTFPENRFGYDIKLDLGIGLWLETSVTNQNQSQLPPYTKAATVGADYTFGIGNGLNVTAEHMYYGTSGELFSNGETVSFTGISASIPVSVITRISAMFFYDWKDNGFYRFANLSLTFDKFAINIIGFWDPEVFEIFNYGTGPNMLAGAGGQVMVVYNY